jgi:pimeloyl-ACP methyl ester carboxylesterase
LQRLGWMDYESVRFTNGAGRKLAGKLFTPEKFRLTIIIARGIAGLREDWESKYSNLISSLTGLGYRVLTFDFTGGGGSEGGYTDTTLTTNIDDLRRRLRSLEGKT